MAKHRSRLIPIAAVVVTLLSAGLFAADHAADEAAIRGLIAQLDAGKAVPRTARRVFWSGAFEKPVLDNEQPTPRKGDGAPENRVAGSQRSTSEVRRLVIAESGDMAYDYSDVSLSFDLKTGTHMTIATSTLRVWQREDGQWKLAVSFSSPLDR